MVGVMEKIKLVNEIRKMGKEGHGNLKELANLLDIPYGTFYDWTKKSSRIPDKQVGRIKRAMEHLRMVNQTKADMLVEWEG